MLKNNRKTAGLLAVICFVLLLSFAAFADPAYSEYWTQNAAGSWQIRDGNGNLVKNAWLCDDAVPSNGQNIWYLIDEAGNMISAGLVQDNTGNYYSLEMNHDGYYGMLRYQSGTYSADGCTVTLELESAHNGSFAAIKNADGLEKLKNKYGITKVNIDNGNCVYTSSFGGGSAAQNNAAAASGTGATQSKQGTATNGTEASSVQADSTAQSISGSTLTSADFKVTGSSVPAADLQSYLSSRYAHDGAVYFYYDSSSDPSRESVVKTARNITLASCKSDVIAAYGNGTAVNVSSPADTKAVRIPYLHDPNGVSKFLKSCLCYTTADGKYSIYFGFKDNGQVSFIIYYIV